MPWPSTPSAPQPPASWKPSLAASATNASQEQVQPHCLAFAMLSDQGHKASMACLFLLGLEKGCRHLIGCLNTARSSHVFHAGRAITARELWIHLSLRIADTAAVSTELLTDL